MLFYLKRLYSRHLPHNSLRRALASGVSWSLVGSVGLRGLSVLAGIVVARLLGRHVFGQWGVIQGIAFMFGSLGGLGMATAATKYVAELKKADPLRAGRVLSLILLVSLLGISITSAGCLGLAKLMAYRLYNAPELLVPLVVTSITLFCHMGAFVLEGVIIGFEDFRGVARINIVQGLILFVAFVFLTFWLGLVGVVIGMAISRGTAMCLYLVVMFKRCREHGIRISKVGMWQELRIVWHYAAPGFLTSCVLHPANVFSYAIVANVRGGFAGLGSYNAAVRWREVVLFIPRAAKRVSLPMLSKLRGANDYKRFKKSLRANVILNGGIALTAALPLMALSRWILRLYGPDFVQDWDILVVLVSMGVLQAVIEVLSQVLVCMEKMWWNFAFHVLWGMIILGGSYLLVPHYGVRGFVGAYTLATIIHMLNHIGAAAVLMKRYYNSTRNPP